MSNNYIKWRLQSFDTTSYNNKINALKQIIQEICLNLLEKVNFFKEVAFCGGTCLRIFYDISRFSEDLDFSLIIPNKQFDLSKYFNPIEKLLNAYGLNFKFDKFKKNVIQSCFLKGNLVEHFNKFFDNVNTTELRNNEIIRIKIEVDTNPPLGSECEQKVLNYPITSFINVYDISSLFAGKVNAILTRIDRVKGRDLYDFVYYVNNKTKINLKLLENSLIQFGLWNKNNKLTLKDVKRLLINKINVINFNEAKEDLINFIKDENEIKNWSKQFFIGLINSL